jgi:SAM-dependent methyltransferase
MVHHKVCPLCSSENIEMKIQCRDYFISKKEFPVYRCTSCDFNFTQDYPDENEIGMYYESPDYISHSDTSEGFVNKLYRAARTLMLRRKRNLVKNTTGLSKGKILDIGSGTGYFAAEMKKAGWTVNGIEINEKARNFSFSHFGLTIYPPEEIDSLTSDSFDCITLWHVLEHFHDPFNYFSQIRRLLKPGGVCVVALPNCSSYDAVYFKSFWAAWDVPRHLWHFRPGTFSLFSEKARFSLDSIGVLPLDVFYISQMSEKYKEVRFPFIQGISKAFVFAILSVFNKSKSSSIIYILRKPTDR